MDPDTINQLALEERAYEKWEREQKKRILSMSNQKRKQEEWHTLFPVPEHDDEWMLEAKVF